MRGVARTRDVPIIFVTAGSSDRNRQFKGYESGAVDFLFKPIEPHILKSKADVFFQLYRQKQQLAWELQQRTSTLRVNEMFMAVLGHDLRGPLSAIQLSAKILEHRPDDGLKQIGARLTRSATWMGRMIEDLLDLTRVRLGEGIPISREPVDLGGVVQGVIQERQVLHPESRVELRQDGTLDGQWDADRLVQVASNLIGNALRHGQPGAPVKVQLDGRLPDCVVVSVENEGCIRPGVAHIFDIPPRPAPDCAHEGWAWGSTSVREMCPHGGSIECIEAARHLFNVTMPRGGRPGCGLHLQGDPTTAASHDEPAAPGPSLPRSPCRRAPGPGRAPR